MSRKQQQQQQPNNQSHNLHVIMGDVLHLHPTRNSAIADKPRDAFRGQSSSPNMVLFHMLGMVSY